MRAHTHMNSHTCIKAVEAERQKQNESEKDSKEPVGAGVLSLLQPTRIKSVILQNGAVCQMALKITPYFKE